MRQGLDDVSAIDPVEPAHASDDDARRVAGLAQVQVGEPGEVRFVEPLGVDPQRLRRPGHAVAAQDGAVAAEARGDGAPVGQEGADRERVDPGDVPQRVEDVVLELAAVLDRYLDDAGPVLGRELAALVQYPGLACLVPLEHPEHVAAVGPRGLNLPRLLVVEVDRRGAGLRDLPPPLGLLPVGELPGVAAGADEAQQARQAAVPHEARRAPPRDREVEAFTSSMTPPNTCWPMTASLVPATGLTTMRLGNRSSDFTRRSNGNRSLK